MPEPEGTEGGPEGSTPPVRPLSDPSVSDFRALFRPLLTVRQLFPVPEASWRIPALLLIAMSGMAAGSWIADVIYDYAGFYAPAFATGIAANLANLVIIAALVVRWRRVSARPVLA